MVTGDGGIRHGLRGAPRPADSPIRPNFDAAPAWPRLCWLPSCRAPWDGAGLTATEEPHMKPQIILFATMLTVPAWAADPMPATGEAPAAGEAAPTQTATAAPPQVAKESQASVARALFTTAIQDREPVDTLNALTNDQTRIYYFSEIRDGEGQRITHRWEHNGKTMSEMSFDIGGNRWRVYSSKTLDPSWTGDWKVSVLDANGATLSVNTFTYEPKPKADTAPAVTSEPAEAAKPMAPSN